MTDCAAVLDLFIQKSLVSATAGEIARRGRPDALIAITATRDLSIKGINSSQTQISEYLEAQYKCPTFWDSAQRLEPNLPLTEFGHGAWRTILT